MYKVLVLLAVFFVLTAVSGALADTTYVCGDVSGVWDSTGSPYYVTDSVCVPSGDSLRIGPGVEVIFMGHYKFCVDSNAILKAIGTPTDSIVFTAEDTVLSDSTGGHQGIRFYYSAEGCSLSFAVIEYGFYSGDFSGGLAVLCDNSHLSLSHSRIENNLLINGYTSSGSAISFNNTTGEIANCVIGNNFANGHGTLSVGIECWGETSPIIKNNNIFNNIGGDGCGIVAGEGGLTIQNNDIYNNDGAGIFLFNHINVLIEGNIIHSNGLSGIWSYSGSSIIINNLIYNNSSRCGGGVYFGYSYATLINNTIVNNTAGLIGGGLNEHSSQICLFNNLFYANTAPNGSDIWLEGAGYSRVVIANCNIDTFESIDTYGDNEIIGTNIINADPLFVDTASWDYHLQGGSPCIDVGAGTVYVSLWDTTIYAPLDDFEGGIRPFGSGWDIGADEYGTGIINEYSRETPQTIAITAYPNPFNSSVNITVGAIHELPLQIEIFDINGRMVYEIPVGARHAVPLPSASGACRWQPDKSIGSGVFLVRARFDRLTDRGDKSITKRVVYLK